VINNPYKTGKSINRHNNDNPVTLYYLDDIHYVAVDDVTGKVIQVSDRRVDDWSADNLNR
jgi:Fe2+ or Zn2+ uptake regulation protein